MYVDKIVERINFPDTNLHLMKHQLS